MLWDKEHSGVGHKEPETRSFVIASSCPASSESNRWALFQARLRARLRARGPAWGLMVLVFERTVEVPGMMISSSERLAIEAPGYRGEE